jgi:chemotaxis protein MotC
VLLPLTPAAAVDQGKQPFEIVRDLQAFQDQAALRVNKARVEQREQQERIAKVATELGKYDPKVWADPRNGRAAVIYVLGGGDPRVLRNLTASGAVKGVDDRLAKGALAYSERRDDEAIKLLEGIDVEALDRSIGGHVALVRAMLLAKTDQRKAYALLDRARVISPGTIVEEAALRRQSILAAKMGQLDSFDQLSSQYFRRYGSSIFARTFEHQFAQEIVNHNYSADPKRFAGLEALIGGLPDVERRETCLAIADGAVAAGNVELVRFAARLAAIDARTNPLEATRMRLFEAAVLIVTPAHQEAADALWTIDRSKLDAREEPLLDAAVSVAREISRPPAAPPPSQPADAATPKAAADAVPPDAESAGVIKNAEQALVQVDGLLNEAQR